MIKIFVKKLLLPLIPFIFYNHIHSYSAKEKHFVVVIPSYNNQRWYERNLSSVLVQKYEYFNVIYTDDCSADGTGILVEQYLTQHDPAKKVTLIKNNTRRGALYNLYRMINMCDDDTIIITLDGDDWFPDNEVLTRLNAIYSSDEVWLTYGQFQLHPSGTRGWASPMPDYIVENNSFRDFQHLPTHLRTFYGWLFKQIKLEDLLYLGQFYPMTWDMTMMFPMIEMAGERHRFISDIMYIYNDENSISDHHVSRQLQAHLAQVIKKKTRYTRLTQKPIPKQLICDSIVDMIIFSQTPQKLQQLFESLKSYVNGIGTVFVMYRPTSIDEIEIYQALIKTYSEIQFYLINEHRINFKETLLTIYHKSESDYILFSKGDTFFQEQLSLPECIIHLQETSAYAFYFKLNAQEGILQYPHLPFIECRNGIFAWNFSFARDQWSSANSLDLVLHKKRDSLLLALHNYYDLTPKGLELAWSNEGNLNRLGLCFNISKVITHYEKEIS